MKLRSLYVSTVLILLLTLSVRAEVKTQAVEYKSGDTTLVGYLAYPAELEASKDQKRPAIVVVHEWWGLNDYPRARARQLAELGYVAFAADIYGNGRVTQSAEEAGQLAGQFKSKPDLLRERLKAAVTTAAHAKSFVDADKIVVIGYCFGGTSSLEAARSGLPIVGVVSIHGDLEIRKPAEEGQISAKVLVLTGVDDPMVPPAQIAAFENEMRTRKADYQVISYGGAVHGFSNPAADKAGIKGVAYNEKADHRSWVHLQNFLAEVVGTPPHAGSSVEKK